MNIQFLCISHYPSWMYRYASAKTKSIYTDLHTKPTDKHQYLLKSSCHPNHTKKTIPFSLLRISCICSTDHFFDQRSKELVNYLMKRGYDRPSVQRAVTRVRAIPRHERLSHLSFSPGRPNKLHFYRN